MIALDTNALIHLLVKSQPEHPRVRQWLLANQEPLVTTHTNVAEALRLLTHPRVFPQPLALDRAVDLVDDFLEQFRVRVLEESEGWWRDLKGLHKVIPALKGNEIFDARIALCLRYHGIKDVCTLDSDFSKYPFLKVVLP